MPDPETLRRAERARAREGEEKVLQPVDELAFLYAASASTRSTATANAGARRSVGSAFAPSATIAFAPRCVRRP
jgi:hypothetical protein